jgi:iron complex transport system permease protein
MGALMDRSWDDVWLALPLTGIGMAFLFSAARALDALTLGDVAARSLGVNMTRLQWLIVAGVGLCVGTSVAVAGIIGFVGLVVPHLVRPLVGHQPSALLIPSSLAGALLVVVADCVVRILPSVAEVRLGIAMAALGTPFFLILLMKMRRETV